MKALVKFDLGRAGMALRDMPEPFPRKGELKVKVLAAGICGGDIHSMNDERDVQMPVILGHEYVGQVVETNGDVGAFKTGDWVVTLPACYSCGECEFCRQGLVTLCRQRKSIGTHVNGAMAEYVIVPAKYSFKVPDDVENKMIYALTEPMGCVTRGVYERIDVKPGDIAVVSGPGTIGLFAVELLKSRGAYVIVSGLPVDQHRLQLALQLGADEIAQSLDELKAAVYRKKPQGADIAVEASGAEGSLDVCLNIVRTHGTMLQLGHYGGRIIKCHLDLVFDKEINFVASNSTGLSTWEIAMRLLREGKIDLKPLLSLQLPLEQWEQGFDAVIEKKAYKVVLLP